MQKLLIMERDTKEELIEAIRKNMEDAKFKITSLSVLQQPNEVLINGYRGYDSDGKSHFEAWIVIDIPDNPNKNHDLFVGFEST